MRNSRRRFRTYNRLLFITGLTYATTWLPFLRGLMDGESYTWGTTLFGHVFSGSGTQGDFYFVVLNAFLGLWLLLSFYWSRWRMVFYGLLVLWNGSMIANAFYEVFFGQGYTFQGDTLGVNVDLSYVILPLMLGIGYLTGVVIKKDARYPFKARWTWKNTYWLLGLLLPLPVQYFLLHGGEPHGLTDQIGVIIALLQVFLLSWAFRAYDILTGGSD